MGGMLTIESKAGQDRISELPDDVVYHILSFLTIKEAIATSLLSTRWRFLWTMLPSLHIDCSKPIMKLYHSVDVFLGLFRTQKISRFHLRCNNDCCLSYAEEWVNAVVSRKVEHVNISLCMCRSIIFRFPHLFICTTLVTLKIEGLFPFSIPYDVHLPNLQIFHLHVNALLSFPSINKLISGSPALELFDLKQNWWESQLKILLKHNSQVIQVFHHSSFYGLVIQDDRDYDFISNCMYTHRWPNILKAKVCLTVHHCAKNLYANQIVSNILQGLCNVEFLSLGDFREEMDPSILDLPNFENLVELRLFLKNADSLFLELPAKCPKLEVLEVNIMDDRYGINQRCRYHITGGVRKHDLSIVPLLPETLILGKCFKHRWKSYEELPINWSLESHFGFLHKLRMLLR
ncbi:putative F-box/LRR-repeat protein [Glycine max]|nr:putative F-box/LRR-repeat protein [Glycine max]